MPEGVAGQPLHTDVCDQPPARTIATRVTSNVRNNASLDCFSILIPAPSPASWELVAALGAGVRDVALPMPVPWPAA